MSQCKKDLIHTLFEIQKNDTDTKNGKCFTNDDRDKLVTYISGSISNLSLQINGQGTQCRYYSHAINLSMSLFLKNKAMYKEIRETNSMSLPSPNVLYTKQLVLQPSPGVNANTMLFMKDLKREKRVL